MSRYSSISTSVPHRIKAKLQDYVLLVKFRLSFIVVFSSAIGYLFAGGNMDFFTVFLLAGFLITAGSNALNEILEVETDKLMDRTMNRPLPSGRMQIQEAVLAAGVMGISGILIMWIFFTPLAALVGAISLLTYSFIYTPLKRITPISVWIGAFPGAVPPLIGWAAATGEIGTLAVLLFTIQFMWQFPHFWSIAWVAFEDYAKADFYLLPHTGGRNRKSALQMVLYSLILIPVSLLPYLLGFTGLISAILIALAGLLFALQSFILFKSCEEKRAKQVMFGSFLYLPIVLIALFIDKV